MICDPCKRGLHAGEDVRVLFEPNPNGGLPIPLEVCKGGTWCDCQHRTNISLAAELVAKKHAPLLERLT